MTKLLYMVLIVAGAVAVWISATLVLGGHVRQGIGFAVVFSLAVVNGRCIGNLLLDLMAFKAAKMMLKAKSCGECPIKTRSTLSP